MTQEEVAQLVRMNNVLYKLGSRPLSDKEMEMMLDVWTYQLKDYPADTVKMAFLAANRVCVYPITIADIFKQLSRDVSPETEWEQLKSVLPRAQRYLSWRGCPMVIDIDENGKAVKSDGRQELQDLFDGLSQSLKSYVGGIGGLMELAQTPDLTYKRLEYLKQAKADIETAPKEAAMLRNGRTEQLLKANDA